MSLDANITLNIQGKHTKVLDLALAELPLLIAMQAIFTDGAGAGQVNEEFQDRRSIAASATDSLDLNGTALQNPYGVNLALVRIKGVFIRARPENANNVLVRRPAANGVPIFSAAGDEVVLKPGGWFAWVDPSANGVTVTPTSGDLLDIVNSAGGTSVDYEIVIFGATT